MTDTDRRFSFSRACRLDGPHAYAAVFAFKCRESGELFQVYARPNGSAVARLGVVVSKRVISQAVGRNYCKRLAREVFRTERRNLGGMDVVVRPRVVVTRASSRTARSEIHDLLLRVQRQCRHRETT